MKNKNFRAGDKVRTLKHRDYTGSERFPIDTIGIIDYIGSSKRLSIKVRSIDRYNYFYYYDEDELELVENDDVITNEVAKLKFKVGDSVIVGDGFVGKITNICMNNQPYEVTLNTGDIGRFYEDELKMFDVRTCESMNKIVNYGDLRLCVVGERTGKFHKWIEEQEVLIKFNSALRPDVVKKVRQMYEENYVLPPFTEYNIVTNTVALVEFEDGTIKKVDPEEVRFVVKRKEN